MLSTQPKKKKKKKRKISEMEYVKEGTKGQKKKAFRVSLLPKGKNYKVGRKLRDHLIQHSKSCNHVLSRTNIPDLCSNNSSDGDLIIPSDSIHSFINLPFKIYTTDTYWVGMELSLGM